MGEIHDSPLNRYAFAQQHRFVWYEAGPTTTISINRALAIGCFPFQKREFGSRGTISSSAVRRLSARSTRSVKISGVIGFMETTIGTYPSKRSLRNSSRRCRAYLNQKLVENGKSPVIAFNDSIFAWSGLIDEGSWVKLGWHMLRIAVRDRDTYTLLFILLFTHRVIEIGMMIMGTLRRKRDGLLRQYPGAPAFASINIRCDK